MAEYIEREAAIKALKGLPTWWGDGGGWYGHAQPPMVALLDPLDAVNAIDNIPAADVQPVAHGKWASDGLSGIIKCIICDADAPVDTTGPRQYKSRFCPNCGARMDGAE